jgi:hypothetical protein
MKTTRQRLLEILTSVQNTERFENQDIMTFSGFMSDEELPEYIWQRFAMLPAADKAHVLEVARTALVEAL